VSVTTITKKIVDKFVPNFIRRFLWVREDQVRVSLRSVEGCGNNGQNSVNRRLFTKTGDCLQNSSVGKIETSGPQNSRCGKCCQVLATKTLSGGFVLPRSTFHLVSFPCFHLVPVQPLMCPHNHHTIVHKYLISFPCMTRRSAPVVPISSCSVQHFDL